MTQAHHDIETTRQRALAELASASTLAALEAWKKLHLGKSGEVGKLKSMLGKVPPEDRKSFGIAVNGLAEALETAFAQRLATLEEGALRARIAAEAIDVTLAGRPEPFGRVHPVRAALHQVCDVFREIGFEVFDSPHVETDDLNFGLLNMPADHPARDMQDTFYVGDASSTGGVVLRTHTSSGQIHAMRRAAPEPIRVLLPGLCYRNEDVTARSEMQFHQIEGLAVGPDIRMSDLKGVLMHFATRMFGADQAVRFRGSYFPFTEPSVEVDIRCTICGGGGCRICKKTGWLELLGAGLVHPVVLANGGYDPAKFRGIAFGMGIERMVMLRHGITDIRAFFGNDERVLGQVKAIG